MSANYQVRRTAYGQHQVWNSVTGVPMHAAESRSAAERRAADFNRRAKLASAARAKGRA